MPKDARSLLFALTFLVEVFAAALLFAPLDVLAALLFLDVGFDRKRCKGTPQ